MIPPLTFLTVQMEYGHKRTKKKEEKEAEKKRKIPTAYIRHVCETF